MNLKCYLFGHKPHELLTGYESSIDICERCGSADDYYGTGEQWTERDYCGVLGCISNYYYRITQPIRDRRALRCDQCNKKLGLFGKRYNGRFCNRECHDNWLPF